MIRIVIKVGMGPALALVGLCACQGRVAAPPPGVAAARPSEAAYRTPPNVTSATLVPDGRVRLVGSAMPSDRVRLTSPAGSAAYARTGAGGSWRMFIAPAERPRLFGLSMIDQGRPVQAEGYLAVTPDGQAAQLRSGAGAVAIGNHGSTLAILAVDFDSKGGTVVSGRASPRALLDLWVDGARRGRGVAGRDGSFSVALDEPLSFAGHHLEVIDGGRKAVAEPTLAPVAAFADGPYRTSAVAGGWRIDWRTPGGGVQTTLLLDQHGGLT